VGQNAHAHTGKLFKISVPAPASVPDLAPSPSPTTTSPTTTPPLDGCTGSGDGIDETCSDTDSLLQFEEASSSASASLSKEEEVQLREEAGDFVYTEEGTCVGVGVGVGVCVKMRACVYVQSGKYESM